MDKYNEVNVKRWNKLARAHIDSEFYNLENFIQGETSLYPIEIDELGDIRGKSILHLQCHFGMDTLSLVRMGAIVTGVDYSEDAINLAQELSEKLQIPANFICADVKDLDKIEELKNQKFDIIFTSHGVLVWLDDLTMWAKNIHLFLKKNGMFYLIDGHPITHIFYNDDNVNELKVSISYFSQGVAHRYDNAGSYAVDGQKVGINTSYEWMWTIGDVLNNLIQAGLEIKYVREHKYSTWQNFPFMKMMENKLWCVDPSSNIPEIPLLFSIKAIKC